MKKSGLCCLAAILATPCTLPTSVRAQAFQSGEILVSTFQNGTVQRYSANGTMEQTYTVSPAGQTEGASLTPNGNLITAYEGGGTGPGVNVFTPGGTLQTSFGTVGPGGFTGDVSVFANGTIAVSDQFGGAVDLYNPTGTLLHTVAFSNSAQPYGSTVGHDGVLYVADIHNSVIGKVDASGNFLGSISLNFDPADMVMDPADTTLWVSGEDNEVYHVGPDGTTLSSFGTDLDFLAGIGLAPDGRSLYVDGEFVPANGPFVAEVEHYDLNGNLLGSFTVGDGGNEPGFLTVVPEPSTWTMLGFGVVGVGIVAWHRRRVLA